jgi:prevent-host-death family protein
MRVSITQLKSRLSRYLRLVKRGETLEVVERSVPIARIEGLGAGAGGEDEKLRRMVRDGVVSRARSEAPSGLVRQPPVPCAVDVVQILVEQRGER